ncbi:AzlD domain-containing protein [Anaerovibrio lipolyticus]|uniref:AzlD domain-containing protein n=1 Tax=Anaerovibrio lipolyticus TaxID=82374 RepID=UPI0026EAF880|nr:AzlD domain-containing protein [Anaerovibrio lipolyticus]MBE6105901.1 AzlD domain-containing protein [Anaerovibrio lipolyticus]
MSYTDILICIFGLFCSSYISRILPLAVLGRRPLPTFLSLWLKYVPTAVFGALIFVSIFGDAHSGFRFGWTNVEFLAAIPVLLVAAKTRNLAYSIIVGLVAYWLLNQYM